MVRRSSSRTGQFQHVVSTTEETPLAGDLQQELPEASRLFDLAKHWFNHLLAQTRATAMPGSSQANLHRVEAGLSMVGPVRLLSFNELPCLSRAPVSFP